ncbi:MAG: glycoside hydrolase family 13 protein [Mycoplasmatales bacterium]
MNKLLGYEHFAQSPYVFQLSNEVVELRLRVPASEVLQVLVKYGDTYLIEQPADVSQAELGMIGTDGRHDWYSQQLSTQFKRLSYYFVVTTTDKKQIIVNEKGVYYCSEMANYQPNQLYVFNFPYMFKGNKFVVPSWVEKTVWYQIFPDRFKRKGNYRSKLKWHQGDVNNEQVYGGNLEGIISELDYLEELGITGIYFTPLFKAGTSHKYDTEDYFEIDPDFGTLDDFKRLVLEAHKRGIRVMLDGVFNHLSRKHPFFLDVLANKEKSQYYDWFYLLDQEQAHLAADHTYESYRDVYYYETFAFEPLMPKLNTENPEVIDYFKKVVSFWTKLGIDAWRLDVAYELSHKFVRELRQEIHQHNPECYFIGEVWHQAQTWFRGDEFDAVMNYSYTNPIVDYFAKEQTNISDLTNRLMQVEMLYDSNVCANAFNVVDTHDTSRLLFMCNEDKNRLRFLITFLFAQKGCPCIYYGTEIGMTGDGADFLNNRKLMVWEKANQDLELFEFYKQLINFRKENAIELNRSKLEIISEKPLMFTTTSKRKKINYILNNTDQAIEVKVATSWLDYLLVSNQLLVNGVYIYEE